MEDILRKLVAFPTVTGDAQAAHELLEYVAGFVSKRGMHVQRFVSNGYASLVATTVAADKTPAVMLGAHADVVAAPDELFELRRDGDKLYGRGVLDMKFALAAYLQIIDDLQGHLHEYSLGLMVTTDEEIGGRDGVRSILQEGYRPAVCLLPDGGENWQVQTASKGVWLLRIIARGTSAHSSRPWEGDNAIKKLLPALSKLEALATDPSPSTNVVTITGLSSGRSVSQIPNRASALVDIRTINTSEYERLYAEAEKICQEHGLEVEVVADGYPTYFDLGHPLIAPYVRLIESTTGIHVTGSFTPATSDARFFTPYDIPCISLYPTGADHHSPQEWISAAAFEHFRAITATYLEETARVALSSQSAQPLQRPLLRQMTRGLRRVVRSGR